MATERDTSKSWWSNHHHPTSNHLLELQKEIKEEEEEIFADINSLINSRSDLYPTSDDCDENDQVYQEEENDFLTSITTTTTTYQKALVASAAAQPPTTTTHTSAAAANVATIAAAAIPITITTTTTTTINNNNINHLRSSYSSRLDEQLFYSDDVSDDEEDLVPDRYKSRGANKTRASVVSARRDFQSNLGAKYNDDDENMGHFHIDSGPPPEEVDFMHQDPYLDGSIIGHHHENDDSNDDYADGHKFSNQISQQAFQAVIQHVTSNLPKPCVFFLEGNCRRSDCKYSHDLSNITCKYWIEGFCFKGEMCPFLHSYNPQSDSSDPNCLDEEGLKLLAQKELNPTFAIESEADFPSLPLDAPASALNDSTKSSNNTDSLTGTIKDQILSSNPAVVFKTVKKKRKRG